MLQRILRVLFAVLVVSVVAEALSAGAAEASPTYFTCTKLAGPTGEYAGAECAKKASTPGTGAYERESAAGLTFTGSAKTIEFKTAGAAIECASATATGKITGASTDEEQVVYEDCVYEKAECFSAGQSKRVVTNELATELVGTVEGSPVVKFQAGPGEGGFLDEFHCGEVLFRTGGFVDAALSSPAGHASEEQSFSSGGETTLLVEDSSNNGATWAGPFATEEIAKSTLKSVHPIGMGTGNEEENGQPVELFGSVDGTVTSGLNPVEEATVVVCKVGGGECYEGETSLGGAYNIEEVEAGTYEAEVVSNFESPYEGARSSQFTVKNEVESTVNFSLSKAATGSVEGTIREAAAPNSPIAQALVRACVVGGHEECYVAQTEPNGAYELPEVRDGSYTVKVEGPFESLYEPKQTGSFSVTTGVESQENVSLSEEPTGSIEGTVQGGAPPEGVQASVSACLSGGRCYDVQTNASGQYEIAKVPVGTYAVTVYPDAGYSSTTVPSVTVVAGNEALANASVHEPPPSLPPGTAIQAAFETEIAPGHKVPVVNWMTEAPMKTEGCKGGTVKVTVTGRNTQTGATETTSPRTLTERPANSGEFEGLLPSVYPIHGPVTITVISSGCSEPSEEGNVEFEIYIDPSGLVVDGNDRGAPVSGATVTLSAARDLDGPFTAVANGSAVMSPANRTNPDTTNSEGSFGWDTLPGFYVVEASKPGCGTATTAAFEVPPPQTSLRLVLHCSKHLKVETTDLPGATRGHSYEAQLSAFGGREPYKWKKVGKLPKGLKLSKTGLLSGTPSTKLAAGEYTIEVSVRDSSKPKHSSNRRLVLDIS